MEKETAKKKRKGLKITILGSMILSGIILGLKVIDEVRHGKEYAYKNGYESGWRSARNDDRIGEYKG